MASDHFKFVGGHFKMVVTLFEDTSEDSPKMFSHKKALTICFYDSFYAPAWVTGFIKSPLSMQ